MQRFICKYERYKNIYLCMFYVLLMVIPVLRIVELVLAIRLDNGEDAAWRVKIVSAKTCIYAKAVLELSQTAQMAELTVEVKRSAYALTEEQAAKRSKWIKIWLLAASIFYCAFGVIDNWNKLHMTRLNENEEPIPKYVEIIYNNAVPFVMFSISIYLLISYIFLSCAMHKYFSDSLFDEALRIRVIFLVLFFSYLSRVTLYEL